MGMTMTQKILASHAGKSRVQAGELILAQTDLLLGNDITAPIAVSAFEGLGNRTAEVFDPEKIVMVMDHFVPNKDINSAEQCRVCRDFCRAHGIGHFYDVGTMGVEHALLPEQGLVTAGALIIGADSHTCTYGALGAFSAGVGSTDLACAMASGKAWFRVPAAIRFRLTGTLRPFVSGKDVILHIIGLIGTDGAAYRSMEFTGAGVAALTVADRLTIANMAVEAGAKNGIFPVDEQTRAYLRAHGADEPTVYEADADAEYEAEYEIRLDEIEPLAAFPPLPSNVRKLSEAGEIPLDQVVIGSCTNGRLEDLRAAAEILRGRKRAEHIRLIVIPATQQVYADAMEQGLLKVFLESGAVISAPTCGPCLGGHMGILAKGERAAATTNRNFVGRMGHPESEVYLVSPATAAASAVAGRLASPWEVME